MDNPPSAQQLEIPDVPSDFNGGIGVDFARALVAHLRTARVSSAGGPSQSDITTLQANMETLQDTLDANLRNQVKVEMSGVSNGQLVVPFQGWGDTDYEITALVEIPNLDNPSTSVDVYVIAGSKQANQFTVRVDGSVVPSAGGPVYKIIFVITQIKSLAV